MLSVPDGQFLQKSDTPAPIVLVIPPTPDGQASMLQHATSTQVSIVQPVATQTSMMQPIATPTSMMQPVNVTQAAIMQPVSTQTSMMQPVNVTQPAMTYTVASTQKSTANLSPAAHTFMVQPVTMQPLMMQPVNVAQASMIYLGPATQTSMVNPVHAAQTSMVQPIAMQAAMLQPGSVAQAVIIYPVTAMQASMVNPITAPQTPMVQPVAIQAAIMQPVNVAQAGMGHPIDATQASMVNPVPAAQTSSMQSSQLHWIEQLPIEITVGPMPEALSEDHLEPPAINMKYPRPRGRPRGRKSTTTKSIIPKPHHEWCTIIPKLSTQQENSEPERIIMRIKYCCKRKNKKNRENKTSTDKISKCIKKDTNSKRKKKKNSESEATTEKKSKHVRKETNANEKNKINSESETSTEDKLKQAKRDTNATLKIIKSSNKRAKVGSPDTQVVGASSRGEKGGNATGTILPKSSVVGKGEYGMKTNYDRSNESIVTEFTSTHEIDSSINLQGVKNSVTLKKKKNTARKTNYLCKKQAKGTKLIDHNYAGTKGEKVAKSTKGHGSRMKNNYGTKKKIIATEFNGIYEIERNNINLEGKKTVATNAKHNELRAPKTLIKLVSNQKADGNNNNLQGKKVKNSKTRELTAMRKASGEETAEPVVTVKRIPKTVNNKYNFYKLLNTTVESNLYAKTSSNPTDEPTSEPLEINDKLMDPSFYWSTFQSKPAASGGETETPEEFVGSCTENALDETSLLVQQEPIHQDLWILPDETLQHVTSPSISRCLGYNVEFPNIYPDFTSLRGLHEEFQDLFDGTEAIND